MVGPRGHGAWRELHLSLHPYPHECVCEFAFVSEFVYASTYVYVHVSVYAYRSVPVFAFASA